jgi:hypothetical protein
VISSDRTDVRFLLCSALLAAAIGTTGFFLAMLRPWHQPKLLVLSIAGVLLAWLLPRLWQSLRRALGILVVGAWLASAIAAGWWYTERYVPFHPSVFDKGLAFTLPDGTSTRSSRTGDRASVRERLHAALASSAETYHRPLVLVEQNYAHGTTALGASRREFTFQGMASVQLPRSLRWSENPYADRSWAFNLHAMGFVERLAAEYRHTRDITWLRTAEEYVLDWISDNHDVWFWYPSEFSWHDHATAIRLRAWVAFWQVWVTSPLATSDKSIRILNAMLAHATRLADPRFYTDSHNHGIYQDLALLEFSMLFPQLEPAARWRELSLARTRRQMSATISPRGVHLEHSPGYHLEVVKLLLEFEELARLNDPTIADRLEIDATITAMADYLAIVLLPNGFLPRLGDTDGESIQMDRRVWSRLAQSSKRLRDFLAEGQWPSYEVTSYLPEGYVIDRSRLGNPLADAAYLLFTAASHPGRGHKHHDDLSFIWYAFGTELLSDAGKYSYNYTDPKRRWIVSSAAHNVVLINGLGFEGFQTRIDEVSHDENLTFIRASHRNFPGIAHTRRLVYLRPTLVFVVDDLQRLVPQDGPDGRSRDFEQLFHLGPEIKRLMERGARTVRLNVDAGAGGVGIAVHALHHDHLAPDVVHGQTDPFQGWLSLKHGSLIPAAVVSLRIRGPSAKFVTALKAYRLKSDADRFVHSVALAIDESQLSISWTDETHRHRLQLPASASRPSGVHYRKDRS